MQCPSPVVSTAADDVGVAEALLSEWRFSEELRTMFREANYKHKVLSYESHACQWSLMPVDRIDEVQRSYRTCIEYGGRTIDFAAMYLGMGHCMVASWDPETQSVWYRHDGGSNGYEQMHNFEVAKRSSPDGKCFHTVADFKKYVFEEKAKDFGGRPLDIPLMQSVPKELNDRCWNIVKAYL